MPASKFAISALLVLGLGVTTAGCGSTITRGSDDARVNDAALSRKLDLKDVDISLRTMLANLDESWAQRIRATGERPGLAIMEINNETDQYGLDTTNLRESFQEQILNMGTFKIIAAAGVDKLKSSMMEQHTDWYNGGTVPQAGNLLGFNYIIGGVLKGETERMSGTARTQYRLYLKAVNIETGEILWIKSADITKSQS
ncbi:MAG: PBP1b-binding outer membrane lipoprotein LpoB [Planctomycetota bacterium]|jgi:PBP1b-binding outer membrane lipoprotein LpoB